jgi:chromosome segregation ATPase
LADDVVCREVKGYAEDGGLQLSGDVKLASAGGANPRIECRSCWQSFPLPEGLTWEVASEPPATFTATSEPAPVPAVEQDLASAASGITNNLVMVLREALAELQAPVKASVSQVEAGLANATQALEGLPLLREETVRSRQAEAALAEELQSLRGRMSTIETAVGAQSEELPRLWGQIREQAAKQDELAAGAGSQLGALEQLRQSFAETAGANLARFDATDQQLRSVEALSATCASLKQEQQALLTRLDAQAEAIRVLHLAAQERIAHREELQAALQKLEQIAGTLEVPKPLPDQL